MVEKPINWVCKPERTKWKREERRAHFKELVALVMLRKESICELKTLNNGYVLATFL